MVKALSSRAILASAALFVVVTAVILSSQFRQPAFFVGLPSVESVRLESAKPGGSDPIGQMPVTAGAGSLGVTGVSQSSSAQNQIIDVDVGFKIRNTNTSGVPCPSDRAEYAVRGHLVGTQEALADPHRHPVVLYAFGMDEGEWVWRFRLVAGYDHSIEMAKRGHVALTVDLAGYGRSGKPHGYLTCFGAQADMLHQIIQQLRNGTYEVEGGNPISFEKVVLVGSDTGGAMVEIEAYSYKDIDGLVIWLWADQGSTPYIIQLYATNAAKCLGGESPEGGGVGGGYLFFGPPTEEFRRDLIYDAEEEVIQGILASRNRNPCGHAYSPPVRVTTQINHQRLKEIKVPVLLLYPTKDPIFSSDGQKQQATHFGGTTDVTTVWFESGHMPMLERIAPDFRKTLSQWLKERW